MTMRPEVMDRMDRLINIMLDSDSDGEAENAFRAMRKLYRGNSEEIKAAHTERQTREEMERLRRLDDLTMVPPMYQHPKYQRQTAALDTVMRIALLVAGIGVGMWFINVVFG